MHINYVAPSSSRAFQNISNYINEYVEQIVSYMRTQSESELYNLNDIHFYTVLLLNITYIGAEVIVVDKAAAISNVSRHTQLSTKANVKLAGVCQCCSTNTPVLGKEYYILYAIGGTRVPIAHCNCPAVSL